MLKLEHWALSIRWKVLVWEDKPAQGIPKFEKIQYRNYRSIWFSPGIYEISVE